MVDERRLTERRLIYHDAAGIEKTKESGMNEKTGERERKRGSWIEMEEGERNARTNERVTMRAARETSRAISAPIVIVGLSTRVSL